MERQIKAIETKYKGYRFRSRLEARWAVFMDSLQQEWIYEPEGYHLNSGMYLPDFYLPDNDMWIEIKPYSPDNNDRRKIEELCIKTYKIGAFCIGMPHSLQVEAYIGYIKRSGDNWVGWRKVEWCRCDYSHGMRLHLSNDRIWCTTDRQQVRCITHASRSILEEHYNSAKSARFEHGETP